MAGSVVWLPKGNGIADGLTLLPPGQGWLLKALLCSGTLRGENLPDDHSLHDVEVRAASFLFSSISRV